MTDKYMTHLDEIGTKQAAKDKAEECMPLGTLGSKNLQGKISSLESLQDLLKRDKEREQDGFPSRIRFRRVLAGPTRVINVPYVVEPMLIHTEFEPGNIVSSFAQLPGDYDFAEDTGHGDGEVGDVIGHIPIQRSGGGPGEDGDSGQDPGPGAGDEDADHAFEEEAYELGKRLIEQLKLPNLKDKPKKVPTDEYTYDLTDRHAGSGQVLDKKETLKRIVKTNMLLNRIGLDDIAETQKMVIGPHDRIFRVLSRERVWKEQAIVIFIRDYSGSMHGEPTKALVNQHLMIYAWLLVEYERRVIPRFFVHDTDAREVSAREYFTLSSGGGTRIASGYTKINEVVEGEALENDYNIYVFQGTDGDDFDRNGEQAIPQLQKILRYTNRMGVTLFKHPFFGNRKTAFEEYIEANGILQRRDVFRMYTMPSYNNVTEEMNVAALKELIAQD